MHSPSHTMGPVTRPRPSGDKKPLNPRTDRLIAMAIWVVTGLLVGFAVAVFAGSHGFVWLALGLVAGLLAAVFRTRPKQQIEED